MRKRIRKTDAVINARMPSSLLRKLDEMTLRCAYDPGMVMVGYSRAEVLRLCIAKGLEYLEATVSPLPKDNIALKPLRPAGELTLSKAT